MWTSCPHWKHSRPQPPPPLRPYGSYAGGGAAGCFSRRRASADACHGAEPTCLAGAVPHVATYLRTLHRVQAPVSTSTASRPTTCNTCVFNVSVQQAVYYNFVRNSSTSTRTCRPLSAAREGQATGPGHLYEVVGGQADALALGGLQGEGQLPRLLQLQLVLPLRDRHARRRRAPAPVKTVQH
jgi:hypothetical protein